MQTNKQIIKIFLYFISLTIFIWIFISSGVSATEEQYNKKNPALKTQHPKIKNKPQKKVVQTPKSFIPSEDVSADQAIAFPTDI